MDKKRSTTMEADPEENQSGGVPGLGKQRFNVNLSSEAYADMADLAKRSRRTMSELIRLALGIVNIASEEIAKGNKLMITDKDGRALRELVIPK